METNDNGTIENVHLAPIGDFIGSDADGNPIDEHLTLESLERIANELNEGNEEVLFDRDHASTRSGNRKDTAALGWFSKFVVDPVKGLFANLKLTKLGNESIGNREYRFVSPTFNLSESGEPVRLHSVGATNLPAFKGCITPIINSESTPDGTDVNAIYNDKEKLTMEINKEDLTKLIEDTVRRIIDETKTEEKIEEVKEEVKEEMTENACSKNEECDKTEDCEKGKRASNECAEPEEEKTVEIIREEVLNTSPMTPEINPEPEWKRLHGREFFDWCASHPNAT